MQIQHFFPNTQHHTLRTALHMQLQKNGLTSTSWRCVQYGVVVHALELEFFAGLAYFGNVFTEMTYFKKNLQK